MYPSPNANKSPHHSPPNTYNIIESNNHRTTNPNPPPPHHEAPLNHRPPPNLPLHNHHTRKPELLHQIRTPPVHRRRRNDLQRQLDHEPRLRKPSKQRTTTLRKRRDIDSTNEPEKLTIKSLHSNTGNRRLPPRAPPLQHRQRLGTRAQSHKQLRQHDRRRPEHDLESAGFEG